MFVEIGNGVEANTYVFHPRNGDFEAWMRSSIKDDELADEVADIAANDDVDVVAARALVQNAIEQRYTAPAEQVHRVTRHVRGGGLDIDMTRALQPDRVSVDGQRGPI